MTFDKIPWQIKVVWRNIWAMEDLSRQLYKKYRIHKNGFLFDGPVQKLFIWDDAPFHLKVKK